MAEDPGTSPQGGAAFGLGDLRALARQVVTPITETLEPYPGLRPYQKDEASLFFGRDTQIFSVVDRLASSHFIAVTGPSGCGKSSLIRAGVIPKLEQGIHAGVGDRWVTAVTTPGGSPIRALAEAIHRDAAPELESFQPVRDMLGSGPDGLVRAVRTFVPATKGKVLLLVNQFEEVFRYDLRGGEEEAVRYVNLLLDVLKDPDAPLFVILTMRTDYIGNCTRFFGLPEAINSNLYLTPRLTEGEMRQAITEPARAFGGDVDEALCEELLRDIRSISRIDRRSVKHDKVSPLVDADRRSEHDHLPLMQHALMRMWSLARERAGDGEGEDGYTLRVDDYEEIGRLAGALNKHAEEIYGGLDDERRQISQQMFRRLTHRDIGHRDIRDPLHAGDMVNVVGLRSLNQLELVVSRFSGQDSSFIRLDGDGFDKDTMIDIGHEALIRNWDRLQTWVAREQKAKDTYFNIAQQKAFHRKTSPNWLGQSWIDENETWLQDLRDRDAAAIAAGVKAAKLPSTLWTNRYRGELEHAGIQFCSLDAATRFLDQSKEHWHAEEEAERRRAEAQQALAEQQRQHAEEAQRLAEAQRAQAEQMQKLAEQQKSQAEQRQRLAEQERQQAEQRQGLAETAHRRRTIVAGVGVLAVVLVALGFIQVQRQKSELAQLESQTVIKEAKAARDKVEADAQIQLQRRIRELSNLRNRLSGLVAEDRTEHLRNRLQLEQLTRGAQSWRHRVIYNPLIRARFGRQFLLQRQEFVSQWQKQMSAILAGAKASNIEVDEDEGFHLEEMRSYLREVDRTPFDIHSSIQGDLSQIPKVLTRPLVGQFSTFAVAPDGETVAVVVQPAPLKEEIRRYAVGGRKPIGVKQITARDLGVAERDLTFMQVFSVSFSPNGRLMMVEAGVTVPAPADDVSSGRLERPPMVLQKFLILDVESGSVLDVVTLDRAAGQRQEIAFSADAQHIAIVTRTGTYVTCAVGRCADAVVSPSADNQIGLVVESSGGSETISLVGLVHQEDGRFLSVYSSDKGSNLRVYELSSSAPSHRLAYRLDKNRNFSPDTFYYCAETHSLVGVSSRKRPVAHAWPMKSGQAAVPTCFWRFLIDAGDETGGVALWKMPTQERRWSKLRRTASRQAAALESSENVTSIGYFEAYLDPQQDEVSKFEFPDSVVAQPAIDRSGKRIFTYMKARSGLADKTAEPGNSSVAPFGTADENSPIYVWQSFSGHHLAQLAGDGAMAEASFGYDEETGNVLVAVPSGATDQVRVIPTRRTTAGGARQVRYRFDRRARSFVPGREDGKSIPARRFSDHSEIEAKRVDGGGIEISYRVPGAADTQTFSPGELAVDALSAAQVAAVSDDGTLIAVPVVSQSGDSGAAELESPPAMLVWQIRDDNLEAPRLMARVSHKSEVTDAIFLGGSRFLVTATKNHGVWLSAWRLDDLRAEICQRLAYYDLGTADELRRAGGVDVSGVCPLQ
ncbi:MAG: hypothetical protein ACR2PM_03285 [Hyphomicrobiales bacterium]